MSKQATSQIIKIQQSELDINLNQFKKHKRKQSFIRKHRLLSLLSNQNSEIRYCIHG